MSSSPSDQTGTDVHIFVRQLYHRYPKVYVTPAIVVINCVVFLFLLANGAGIMGNNIDAYIEHGANFGPLTKQGEWWRLLSANFLHFGIIHLAFNMWALWQAGRLTERLYGHINFATIYLYAGLLGSLGSLYWNDDSVVSAGASGAVFGVFGALLAYLITQKHSIPYELLKQLRNSTLFFTGFSLFYGFSVPGIDNAAHLGGLASGVLLGLILSRPISDSTSYATKTLFANIFCVLLIIAAVWLSPAASFDYRAQEIAEQNIKQFIDEEKRLLGQWRKITKKLERNLNMDADETLQELNIIHSDWLMAQRLVNQHGKIREKTTAMIEQLVSYATLRADNTRHLIDYLKTGNPASLSSIGGNNRKIKTILEQFKTL